MVAVVGVTVLAVAGWLRVTEASSEIDGKDVPDVACALHEAVAVLTIGGWPGLVYLRLHGTPRVYTSAYEPGWLHRLAERIVQARRETAALWCIFDNTAEGHALRDAMALQQAVDHLAAVAPAVGQHGVGW